MARVHVSSPMELLRGGLEGDRNLKQDGSRLLQALFSGDGILYGRCYGKSHFPDNRIFVAVIFVIIGTYCLFIAGSTAILKFMKRRKDVLL